MRRGVAAQVDTHVVVVRIGLAIIDAYTCAQRIRRLDSIVVLVHQFQVGLIFYKEVEGLQLFVLRQLVFGGCHNRAIPQRAVVGIVA